MVEHMSLAPALKFGQPRAMALFMALTLRASHWFDQ